MKYYETIVVGGGPAGSSCAWQLQRHGREVLVLDKQPFPRLKLCAGWVPAKVMDKLFFTPEDYPYSILKLNTKLYFSPFRFPLLGSWAIPWRTDYSIRRIEFDHWLLEHSQADFEVHCTKQIKQQGGDYIIDDLYQCKNLVGAGGTGCPVRRTFFPKQRVKTLQISTIEKEFKYPKRDQSAHLFFHFHGLRGYAWYVPKGDGFVNLGLAGSSRYFANSGSNIHTHFQWFLSSLVNYGLLDIPTSRALNPSGHGYYLFTHQGEIKKDNCFLIGDSAGLASLDLGEGIGPAVESGLLAANEIIGEGEYGKEAVSQFSLNPAFHWLQNLWSYHPSLNTTSHLHTTSQ
ncbi:MAG: NAD(P)/FAD-dependent oxidoreductase [Leptolyngbyaceae cyanobacterium MO_188.B28]|nr:NAD(P)/FAD-dependent oxidoreductase [Leptolyngbyaceae cyanobacterium MO_188.B28]